MKSLKDKIQIINRATIKDDRGWFLKAMTGREDFLPNHIGEVYITMAKPAEWRANHYHLITAEWFTVFQGEALVVLVDIDTRERLELNLRADEPKTLFVPPRVAHVFINDSTEEMLLLAYAENKYDSLDTIQYKLA